MIVKSTNYNFWLTSAHNSSIDTEGLYLPSDLEIEVNDEFGNYLLTLDGIVEVKEDNTKLNEKPLISGEK